MFDALRQRKQLHLEYQSSFFTPFNSSSEAKNNVKALAIQPILNLLLALSRTYEALTFTISGAIFIACGAVSFDLTKLKYGAFNLVKGALNIVASLYYLVSIITDTLETLVRLVTHSLATVALRVWGVMQQPTDLRTSEGLSEIDLTPPMIRTCSVESFNDQATNGA